MQQSIPTYIKNFSTDVWDPFFFQCFVSCSYKLENLKNQKLRMFAEIVYILFLHMAPCKILQTRWEDHTVIICFPFFHVLANVLAFLKLSFKNANVCCQMNVKVKWISFYVWSKEKSLTLEYSTTNILLLLNTYIQNVYLLTLNSLYGVQKWNLNVSYNYYIGNWCYLLLTRSVTDPAPQNSMTS